MHTRWKLVAFGALGVAIAAALVWSRPWSRPVAAPENPTVPKPLASAPIPFSSSPFLNAGADATFVGSDACAKCHRAQHQSYLLTPHSRALADLDPGVEPQDYQFHHPASARTYRVYRQDGKLRHAEVLRAEDGREIAQIDLPIRYLIGSGNFCRSYLVEVDGFLHESPLTWYTSKKRWDMSPGYDFPEHWSFERMVKMNCLVCHVGRVEPKDDGVNRLAIHEQAIGCENCHGPGSLHVAMRSSSKQKPQEDDLTIVNPAKLKRSQVESVCAVCHQSGVATIYLRGRQVTDFRAGMPLTDYRIDYRFAGDNEQMSVVGHVEQLRQSACYKKSKDMTCVTCHDPHARQKPADAAAYYRQKCISCHESQPCRLDVTERTKKSPGDHCAICHMPHGDTDIPHIAFSHHRIGIHQKLQPKSSTEIPVLEPADDDSHLPPLDRKRNLALAYLEVVKKPDYSRYADTFRERARSLLDSAYDAGLRDGETCKALAELNWQKDHRRAAQYGREALADSTLSTELRGTTLLLLADCHLRDNDVESAISLLEKLVRIRRFSEDWRLLGVCYLQRNQPRKALDALKQSLAIRPWRHDIHHALAETYRLLGDFERAKDHFGKAQWLHRRSQN